MTEFGGAWMIPVCSKCHKPHDNILVPCPHCGYQHSLTKAGKELQKERYPDIYNSQLKKEEK